MGFLGLSFLHINQACLYEDPTPLYCSTPHSVICTLSPEQDPAAIAAELYPSIAQTLAVDPSRVEIRWMMVDGQPAPLSALVYPEEQAPPTTSGRRLHQVPKVGL